MILNPTIELTGEYMCLVSNFENEVSEKEEMTVWGEWSFKVFKSNLNIALNTYTSYRRYRPITS